MFKLAPRPKSDTARRSIGITVGGEFMENPVYSLGRCYAHAIRTTAPPRPVGRYYSIDLRHNADVTDHALGRVVAIASAPDALSNRQLLRNVNLRHLGCARR